MTATKEQQEYFKTLKCGDAFEFKPAKNGTRFPRKFAAVHDGRVIYTGVDGIRSSVMHIGMFVEDLHVPRPAEPPTYLLVLDLETTGLDERKDQILESYCVLLDNATLATPVAPVAYNHSLFFVAAGVLIDLPDVVKTMHTENGLIAALREDHDPDDKPANVDLSPQEVEHDVLGMINDAVGPDARVLLTGNSVHFDRKFIAHHMPRLDARLSHAHVDVSAARRALGLRDDKPKAHRAQADVEASIDVLRKLRQIGANFSAAGGTL